MLRSALRVVPMIALMAMVRGERSRSINRPEMGRTTDGGIEWLKENAEREEITKTHSGMQYRVIEAGDPSGNSPGPSTECEIAYIGKFTNGTVITKSREANKGKTSKMTPSGTLKCMGEAMQLMRDGDHWEVFCPSELAFGRHARTYNGFRILGGTVLILEIELVKVGERPDPKSHPDNHAKPEPWTIESPILHLNDHTLNKYLKEIQQGMIFFYDSDCRACQNKPGFMSEWASLLEDTHSVAALNCRDNFKSCGIHKISEVPTLILVNNIRNDIRPYVGELTIPHLMQFWEETFTYMLKKDGLTSNSFNWDQLLDYQGNMEEFINDQARQKEERARLEAMPEWLRMDM